ncbi:MAG: hypothetical protein HY606_09970 [Planctomycetes bacterium]|nr:hypothetical protein [Planctomycetota bacterium]
MAMDRSPAGTFIQAIDGGTTVNVIKYNDSGVLAWSKSYYQPYGYARNTQIKALDDGSYIVAFEIADLSSAASSFVVVRLNSAGSTLMKKRIHTLRPVVISDILVTNDGFIITGHFYDPNYFWTRSNIFTIKLDPSLNVIWRREYINNSTGETAVASKLVHSYIVITGNVLRAGQSNILYLMLDNAGVLVQAFEYTAGLGVSLYPTSMDYSGGQILIAGYTDLLYSNGFWYMAPFIMKLDSRGKQIYQKVFYDQTNLFAPSTYVFDVKISQGNIYLSGTSYKGSIYSFDGWVGILDDTNGNIVEQKTFGGNGDESFSHIYPDAAGYTAGGNSNISAMTRLWSLKNDSSGIIFNSASGFLTSLTTFTISPFYMIRNSFKINNEADVAILLSNPQIIVSNQSIVINQQAP